MNARRCLQAASGFIVALGLCAPAAAGVLVGGTRLIMHGKDREASIPVMNTGAVPYVVQAWIDAGEGKNKTPFLVTPPLSRLDAGKENALRIMRVPAGLPTDRESVYWLNVKEIPEKAAEENVLQIAVRTRIKLFYRPDGLPGKPFEARQQLQWAVSADDKGGALLKVGNPTAYHVTLTTLNINGGAQEINADLVAPFGEASYPLTAIKSPQEIQLTFSTLDDYGSQTPEESLRVPVAQKPIAVKTQGAAGPATDKPVATKNSMEEKAQ